MVVAQIKKILLYVFAHISLSMVWLFFLELVFKTKRLLTRWFNNEFLDIKFDLNSLVALVFAVMFLYTLHMHSIGIENLAHTKGVLFDQQARALIPKEMALIYTLVGFRVPLTIGDTHNISSFRLG